MSLYSKTILPKDKPQIITSRAIAAPRELVWKMLTTPEHMKHFWGPDGFTNTFKSYDLRVGGEARFTMHGPDGTDYPNRFIFKKIEPPHLLSYDHDNGGEGPIQHKFLGEVELLDEAGKTRIELRMTDESIAARDAVVKYAVEGGKQNLDRFAAYVAPMVVAKNLFHIERSFAVSQERLFQAFCRVEDLKHWLAAPGMKVIHAMQDFKPGGIYHYGTATAQGQEMWGKITYKEITPNSRLVYLQSFSDKDGGLTKHPMSPNWPEELVTICEFIAEGPKQTKLKLSWIYAVVDDTEAATFHAAHDGMTGGWTGAFDMLTNYLTNA